MLVLSTGVWILRAGSWRQTVLTEYMYATAVLCLHFWGTCTCIVTLILQIWMQYFHSVLSLVFISLVSRADSPVGAIRRGRDEMTVKGQTMKDMITPRTSGNTLHRLMWSYTSIMEHIYFNIRLGYFYFLSLDSVDDLLSFQCHAGLERFDRLRH